MNFDVKFKTYDGGLGRALEGDDHISGMVFIDADAAESFAVYYSIGEAELAGITAADEPTQHYHIAQYFLQQPQGVLYVCVSPGSAATAVEALQNYAEGNIKQMAILDTAAFSTATVSALQAKASLLSDAHKPLQLLYTTLAFVPVDTAPFTISTLPDLSTLQSPNVSVVVGADESGRSCLGATLGVVSLASVAENIGAVKNFNVVKSSEYNVLGFITGEKYRGKTDAELIALTAKRYIYLKKYTGFVGSFHNDSVTAAAASSDYSTIENNRTLQKAERVIRKALLPELGSKLGTKAGGLLDELTVTKFELLVKNQLEAMKNANEIGDFKVVINPAQNVLATSKLEIQVGITPLGIARMIEVGIGFAL